MFRNIILGCTVAVFVVASVFQFQAASSYREAFTDYTKAAANYNEAAGRYNAITQQECERRLTVRH